MNRGYLGRSRDVASALGMPAAMVGVAPRGWMDRAVLLDRPAPEKPQRKPASPIGCSANPKVKPARTPIAARPVALAEKRQRKAASAARKGRKGW